MIAPEKQSSGPRGFCQIPHSILTALAGQSLTGAEFQIVLAILYELYRWQPDGAKPKAIGAYDFQQMTNLPRRTIKRTIKNLEQARIIRVQRQPERRKTSVYSINPVDWWRPRHYLRAVASDLQDTSASDVQDTSASDRRGRQLVTYRSPLRNKRKEDEERQEVPGPEDKPALSSNNGNGHKATPSVHMDLLPPTLAGRWYQQEGNGA